MSRIRYLKPSFFLDEDISELPHWIRLLYQGLWVIADKEGILEDRPKRIKAEIFPYESADIENGLAALASLKRNKRPFIVRYEVDGEKYIQILKWRDHQKPHHTEKESVFPPAPPFKDKDKDKDKPAQSELEVKEPLNNGEITVKDSKSFADKHFEELWVRYPNKDGKKAAFIHFRSSVKTEQDLSDIRKALENYLQSERVKKGFIKNGATWFNNWRDWIDYKPLGNEIKQSSVIEKMQKIKRERQYGSNAS